MKALRTLGVRLNAVALAGALLAAVPALAQPGRFAVDDRQLAQLGVVLDPAEQVERVEVATGPGRVVVPPAQQALVAAPVGGLLARLLVAEGETVEADQPVAELDSAELLELERAFVDARAKSELAAAQEVRDRELHADGIIAERRLQESRAAARAARAALDQTQARLALAGNDGDRLDALATRGALESRLAIRAPLAGVVAAVHADVGARLETLDPVLAIADLRTLWIELRLAEHEARGVRPGMRVAAETGSSDVGGVVTTVGRVIDPVTQTVLIRAELDAGADVLRAGQFLVTQVLAEPADGSAWAVPARAVTRNGGRAYVFEREAGGFVARPVTVLAEGGDRVYVTERLDREIAVEGIGALKALWLGGGEDS